MPESLEELTNVPFPWEISAGDFEKIAETIVRNPSIRVSYEELHCININDETEDSDKRYVSRISGSFTQINPLAIATFTLHGRNNNEHCKRFYSLGFITTIGYQIDELNPEEVKLIKSLKEKIESYFMENQLKEV